MTCSNCPRWIETELSRRESLKAATMLKQCIVDTNLYCGESICEIQGGD